MIKCCSISVRDLLTPPVLVPAALVIGLAIYVGLRPYLG